MRLKLAFFLVVPVLTAFVSGQSPKKQIEDAHGGAGFLNNLTGYALSGTLQRPDGTSLSFSLMVQGESSRFETNEGVSIYNGDVQQWWKKGGAIRRSKPRYSMHGAQEIYLSPFYVAARLDKYELKGRDKADRFSRKPQYKRFVNYEPDTPVTDLEFDSETHLLAAVSFYTQERSSERLTLRFEEYKKHGQLWFPSKVKRQAGDRLLVTMEIHSLDFNPVFSSDTFKITR
ncbi:MAG: hypothetical protein EHM23_04915 [Acidobacteria bacterium]|nr:MAG: hypothetical protein EHM23_04915 [Acidobacteriota bacterium]